MWRFISLTVLCCRIIRIIFHFQIKVLFNVIYQYVLFSVGARDFLKKKSIVLGVLALSFQQTKDVDKKYLFLVFGQDIGVASQKGTSTQPKTVLKLFLVRRGSWFS